MNLAILDAMEGVIATRHGNAYGLTEADQLTALRMAVDALTEAIQHSSPCGTMHRRFQKFGDDRCDLFLVRSRRSVIQD